MNYFGDILLSDSAFACDEDCQIGGSNGYGSLQRRVQSRVVADYVVLVF